MRLLAGAALAWLLAAEGWLSSFDPRHLGWSVEARVAIPPPKRFTFKIDPSTLVQQLLPTPPERMVAPLPWKVETVKDAPEVEFGKSDKPSASPLPGNLEKLSKKEQITLIQLHDAEAEKLTERIAHQIAKINHLNKTGKDHFMLALIQGRHDLRGLPFTLGDACRTAPDFSKDFAFEVAAVQDLLRGIEQSDKTEVPRFFTKYRHWITEHRDRTKIEKRPVVQIAALMQILGPEPGVVRVDLVTFLSEIDHPEATRALARLAVFSFEEKVRIQAIKAMMDRPGKDYMEVLRQGLQYPRPEIAQNAAHAVAQLGCKELIPQMLDQLDASEPWAPIKREGRKHPVVREVVRINHHRNCLLCHAPGNTEDLKLDRFGATSVAAVAPVPVPGQTLAPSGGYGRGRSPDILVRADVTYLRQDFSQLLPVPDAAPWPVMQRFDFLVREREVSAKEAAEYQGWLKAKGTEFVSPWRQAIHDALAVLTERHASAPTATAWREVLGSPKR